MQTKVALASLLSFTFLAAQSQAASGCEVPRGMKKEQKLACVRNAGILLQQPELSMEQVVKGPHFDPADPDNSRHSYFTGEDGVLCYFRPHYAFKRVKGRSLKFQCWQMDDDRSFFGRKGQRIEIEEARIGFRKNKAKETRSRLYEAGATNNDDEVKADRIKVKYLKPPHPNHNRRYNEVFTEVAATRILWTLGFPSDAMYPVGSASCVGCGGDPFKDNLKDNKASIRNSPSVFQVAAVERQNSFDEIDPEGDETWSWRDTARFYKSGWTRRQKIDFDAYRLALSLITYHNAVDQQNRLVCAEWEPAEDDPTVCLRPLIFVQDLGSTFGRSRWLGANPRGSFKDWRSQSVFKNLSKCELRHRLRGDKRVLEEARELVVERLVKLDADTVKNIFRVARFDIMDQRQLERLREAGVENVGEAALEEWTNLFMERVGEIREAANCLP